MVKDIWLMSDPHFGHDLMTKVRPWPIMEDHDNYIVDRCNSVVKPEDKLFILGDVAMGRKHIKTVGRLNGIRYLVMGNHDIFADDYVPFFKRVLPFAFQAGMVITHMPLHINGFNRWGLNVHGHMHDLPQISEDHFCVSMECINYTPIHVEEVRASVRRLRSYYKYTKSED